MKKLKIAKITLFLCALLLASQASADGYALYADKIHELERQGHINSQDATDKILTLKLRGQNEAEELKNQARGVASAIGRKKVIRFVNEPIEVSLPKN